MNLCKKLLSLCLLLSILLIPSDASAQLIAQPIQILRPDLTIDAYFTFHNCKWSIVITNIGVVRARTGINLVSNGNGTVIKGGPIVLKPGEQHVIPMSIRPVHEFQNLIVDPNNDVWESNEGNNTTRLGYCEIFPPSEVE